MTISRQCMRTLPVERRRSYAIWRTTAARQRAKRGSRTIAALNCIVVAIALPLTDETRGLFDAQRIAKIKPGAILINIGRGAIVNTDALIKALQSGHLGGACLDVTDPEPLPADSPLWAMKNVVITPHVAGRAELTKERRLAVFRDNVKRFGKGAKLVNVVDKKAGY